MSKWFVIPYVLTGEDDYGFEHVAIFHACNRKIAQGGEHEFGSWDAYVCDVSEDLWGKHVTDNYDTGSAEHSGPGYVYVMRSCDCGEPACSDGFADHDSLTVCIQWDAGAEFAEFETLDAARKHARENFGSLGEPIVIGGDE